MFYDRKKDRRFVPSCSAMESRLLMDASSVTFAQAAAPPAPLIEDPINPLLDIPGVGLVGPDGKVVGPSFNPDDAIKNLPPPNPSPDLYPDVPFPPMPPFPPIVGPQLDPVIDDKPVDYPGRLLNPVAPPSVVLLPLPPEYQISANGGSGGSW